MVKVKKLFGEIPTEVVVNAEVAAFDAEGIADVSEDAADTFTRIPGYEVVEDTKPAKKVPAKKADEDEEPKKAAPKKAPVKKPAPKPAE